MGDNPSSLLGYGLAEACSSYVPFLCRCAPRGAEPPCWRQLPAAAVIFCARLRLRAALAVSVLTPSGLSALPRGLVSPWACRQHHTCCLSSPWMAAHSLLFLAEHASLMTKEAQWFFLPPASAQTSKHTRTSWGEMFPISLNCLHWPGGMTSDRSVEMRYLWTRSRGQNWC